MTFIGKLHDSALVLGFEAEYVSDSAIVVSYGDMSHTIDVCNGLGDIFYVATYDNAIGDNEFMGVEIMNYGEILDMFTTDSRTLKEINIEFECLELEDKLESINPSILDVLKYQLKRGMINLEMYHAGLVRQVSKSAF